jgi:hypothetical protein
MPRCEEFAGYAPFGGHHSQNGLVTRVLSPTLEVGRQIGV